MFKKALLLLGAAGFIAACGGGSSVSSSKRFNELSENEIAELCKWTVKLYGGEGKEIDCGAAGKGTVMTINDCVYDAAQITQCTFTVAQYETCARALSKDLCNFETVLAQSNDCEPVRTCNGGSSGQGPQAKHPIDGEPQCLSCHENGDYGATKIPSNHAGRTNDQCTSCHAAGN